MVMEQELVLELVLEQGLVLDYKDVQEFAMAIGKV
jgi:hypothetical protein